MRCNRTRPFEHPHIFFPRGVVFVYQNKNGMGSQPFLMPFYRIFSYLDFVRSMHFAFSFLPCSSYAISALFVTVSFSIIIHIFCQYFERTTLTMTISAVQYWSRNASIPSNQEVLNVKVKDAPVGVVGQEAR